MPVASTPEPQNRMRASANAAGIAISMVMVTVKTDTIAEFLKNVRYCDEVRSAM